MYIIDDFYSVEDYEKMFTNASSVKYTATYQPNERFFQDRLKAYPCYQSDEFKFEDNVAKIFIKTFEEKSKFRLLTVKSYFRKILSSELKTIFKYGIASHQDSTKFDFAGVIYYNIHSLYDGTAIYSSAAHREPDIIIGAKTNRCVFYNPQLFHSPLHDKDTEVRLIQPFFITIEK